MPVQADLPEIDVTMPDRPDFVAIPALGAKGCGEIGDVGIGAAMGDAVCNAIGMRVRDLPSFGAGTAAAAHRAQGCLAEPGDRTMARAFITGSVGGLGLMAAALLVGQGHAVVLHARDPTRADAARSGRWTPPDHRDNAHTLWLCRGCPALELPKNMRPQPLTIR